MPVMFQRIKNIFTRKATPVVPDDIVNNEDVQKAIFKARRKRRWKFIRRFLLGSTILSIGIQFIPGSVSTTFDRHMTEKGHPANLQEHFHTSNIRVYDRINILYPFHFSGMTTHLTWSEELNKKNPDITLWDVALEPVNIGIKVISGYTQMLPGNKLDAWSISGSGPVEGRYCYIRPPGDFSLERYLQDFSGIKAEQLNFKNDHKELSRILYAYVMLHEARHCDQDKRVHASPLNESDADLYAFKILQTQGERPELLAEAHDIMLHLRTLNSVIGGDSLHTTTFTLERKSQTAMDAHNDAATFWRLRQILIDARSLNEEAFPDGAKTGGQFYYLTSGMMKAGLFDGDKQLTKAAKTFMSGVEYFDKATHGAAIDREFNPSKLDFSFFDKKYEPVKDKLKQPPKPPRPSV